MKRVCYYSLEIFYFGVILLCLVVSLKPGAAIFYKKQPFSLDNAQINGESYLIDLPWNGTIYSSASILVREGDIFLDSSTQSKVRNGEPGTYAYQVIGANRISIRISPISQTVGFAETEYSLLARPAFISRIAGFFGLAILLLGSLILSFGPQQFRKTIKESPIGALKIWVRGSVGEFIFQLLERTFYLIINSIRSRAHEFGMARYLTTVIILPSLLLVFYGGFFALVSSLFLPRGVNYQFAIRLCAAALITAAITSLIVVIIQKDARKAFSATKQPHGKFNPVDHLIFLLLPLTPITQYFLTNLDTLSILPILIVLGVFLLLSALYVFILPYFLSVFGSLHTFMMLGLAFEFVLFNMAALSHTFSWYETGQFWLQLSLLLGLFLLLRFIDRKIVFLFIILNFLSNGAFQIISQSNIAAAKSQSVQNNPLDRFIGSRNPVRSPNIYLLVYDAYAPEETMSAHGIDNSETLRFLSDQGFHIYPGIYSTGSNTLTSMSRVFNISADYDGSRTAVAGDGIVQKVFRNLGYETWGLFPSDYLFRGTVSRYDLTIPENSLSLFLLDGILLGEFRFNLGFEVEQHSVFIERKLSHLRETPDTPLFVYSHTSLPGHSQNSGVCLKNEIELYQRELIRANAEMREDVNTLQATDPEAIIIVAGDHGPYLTKNCLASTTGYDQSEIERIDIQDRYGAFLSIHWPTEDYPQYDEITVLQDIFPAIFAYLYQDENILDARVKAVTEENSINGIRIENGYIRGGMDDGEPLFLNEIP